MRISRRAQQIEESATLASAQKARELKASGVDVISLTLGEPDFDAPAHVQEAAIAAIKNHQSDHYTNATGILPLKEAIVAFHKKQDGVDYTSQEVLVGTGAKHILYVLCQALLEEGDKVLVPTPYWVSYTQQIRLAGATPLIVPTSHATGFKVSVDQLEEAYDPAVKALIINSPSNPSGAVYSKEELMAIGNWAVDKGILIIADEIYNRLVYGDQEVITMAALSPAIKKASVIVNGVAKAYAMTGWRVGYVLSEQADLLHAMGQIISHETSNLTAVSQYAALAAYAGDQEPVEQMRRTFEERLNLFYDQIVQIEGFVLDKPKGAFYLFPDVSAAAKACGYASVKDFCDALLHEAHVAVVSGEAFGMADCLRMSYAGDSSDLLEAARRIKAFVESKTL